MSEEFVIRLKHINDRFDLIQNIGKGTYGEVWKSRDKLTGQIYALKKSIQQPNSDFSYKTIREVQIIKECKHQNICDIKWVVQLEDPREGFYLIFEYCEYDLSALISKRYLSVALKKSLMLQLIVALQYFATQNIIHRDLKPANLFVTKDNWLKIGDFGLARYFDIKIQRYSSQVITSWYRPPELIMSDKNPSRYRFEIDIWSAGCILYEIVTGEPLFKTKNNVDVEQLITIFRIAGPPNDWMRKTFEHYLKNIKLDTPPENTLKSFLKHKFKDYPEFYSLVDLLIKMLDYTPEKRITADRALNHKFFQDMNTDILPANLPPLTYEEIHQKDVHGAKQTRSSTRTGELHDNIRPPRIIPT